MPRPSAPSAGHLLDVSVLIEHFAAATAAHCAGRREAGVMTEALADDNPLQPGAAIAARATLGAREGRQGRGSQAWRPSTGPAAERLLLAPAPPPPHRPPTR